MQGRNQLVVPEPQQPSLIERSKLQGVYDRRVWDPFLQPEWRWERVLKLIDRQPYPGRTTRHDDEYIKAGRAFALRWRKHESERQKLEYENPGLFHAYRVWDDIDTRPDTQFILEARILSGQEPAAVAHELNMNGISVEWYEKLFFDVRPRLTSHDWIVKQVLLPAADRMIQPKDELDSPMQYMRSVPVVKAHMDWTLKFFAYFGGPIVCEFMIGGFRRGLQVHVADELMAFFNNVFMTTTARRNAQAMQVFEINKYNVLELAQIHTSIISIMQSNQAKDGEKTAVEKHVHAMLTEIPWIVGRDAQQAFEGTEVGRHDEMAGELDTEELMLMSAGQHVSTVTEMPGLRVPTDRGVDKEVS